MLQARECMDGAVVGSFDFLLRLMGSIPVGGRFCKMMFPHPGHPGSNPQGACSLAAGDFLSWTDLEQVICFLKLYKVCLCILKNNKTRIETPRQPDKK